MLKSDLEEDIMVEDSTVVSEAETSLARRIFYESETECRSVRWDLRNLLHNDGHARRFKMCVGSTEYLDDTSIQSA